MKMTEVGWIPKDWEVKKVSDVATNSTGLTYSPDDVSSYGTLVLRSSNIQNDVLAFEDNVFVLMDIPERAIAHTGDILVCVRNGSRALIGKSAPITEKADGMAFGAFMTVLRATDITPQYLLYAWRSNIIQEQINATLGATINQITNADLKTFDVPLPTSPSEQRRIAQVLSDADSLIASLSRTIEKKRLVKQGAMQQLLTGKTRLKGFSGEWVEKSFEELFKPYSTASFSRDQMGKNGEVLCIHYGDIHVKYGHIVRLALEDVPTIADAQAGKFMRLQDGDIIMADASEDYEGVGKCISVITNRKEAIAGLHTILLRPKEDIKFDCQFTSYLLAGRFVKQQIENLAEGTKVYSISFKKIKDVIVRYPQSLVEQNAIANILTTMDNEIASLEAELQKYKALKQGMMQKLLTGQIRLK